MPGTAFLAALDVGVAFALHDAGTPWCGVDTCDPYLRVGDRLLTAVGSLGYAFDL